MIKTTIWRQVVIAALLLSLIHIS
ncbi:hypothetical protein, partial [Klebsiella pneumoniae]